MKEKLRQIPYWGALALLVYMPFHVFISQWLSTFTGGLDYWKGAKDALTFVLLIASVILVAIHSKKTQKTYWYLVAAGAAYGLLHVVLYLANKDTSLSVAGLATAYNSRLIAYAIIGYSAALLSPEKIQTRKLIKLILIISTIVCLVGLLQYVLPKDIMTHFGYSVGRGVKPNFFINEDPAFPRIMSTLRDPNSLGAFLLAPIILLVQLINTRPRRPKIIGGLLAVHMLALYLSFSRAAWGGLVIALGLLFYLSHKDKILPVLRRSWPVAVVLVVAFAFIGYTVRDTQFVRSVVFRIDDKNPADQLDSDQLHARFVREGIQGVADKPLGHGPGTAGIVSIQNPEGTFLTENYYIQIAHEVGLLGLALFAAVVTYILLILVKHRSVNGTMLIATMGAYVAMSLVMHLWTNEAVAAQWWMLAGIVLNREIK